MPKAAACLYGELGKWDALMCSYIAKERTSQIFTLIPSAVAAPQEGTEGDENS